MVNTSIAPTSENANITAVSADGIIQLVVPQYISSVQYTGTADLQGITVLPLSEIAIAVQAILPIPTHFSEA